MTVLLVALGAAAGAPLRLVVGHALDARFPWGTLVVNVMGSTLLGYFSAIALSGGELALLGTGFCGGLTTYSAFAVKTQELGWSRGALYAASTVALALAGCAVGFGLGS